MHWALDTDQLLHRTTSVSTQLLGDRGLEMKDALSAQSPTASAGGGGGEGAVSTCLMGVANTASQGLSTTSGAHLCLLPPAQDHTWG